MLYVLGGIHTTLTIFTYSSADWDAPEELGKRTLSLGATMHELEVNSNKRDPMTAGNDCGFDGPNLTVKQLVEDKPTGPPENKAKYRRESHSQGCFASNHLRSPLEPTPNADIMVTQHYGLVRRSLLK